MGPLEVMKGQPVSDDAGWLDVDKNTLQHKKYGEKEMKSGCGIK